MTKTAAYDTKYNGPIVYGCPWCQHTTFTSKDEQSTWAWREDLQDAYHPDLVCEVCGCECDSTQLVKLDRFQQPLSTADEYQN